MLTIFLFQVQIDDFFATIESPESENVATTCEPIQFKIADFTDHIDSKSMIDTFSTAMNDLKIPEIRIDQIYQQTNELIKGFASFASNLMTQNTGYTNSEALEMARTHFCEHLKKSQTAYKRQKQAECNSAYVEPIEFAIGTHFEMKKVKDKIMSAPKLLQSIGHYIPITETLRSQFKHNKFLCDTYMKYNSSDPKNRDHVCDSNVYRGFCCGSVFKNNELYRDYPESLQIRIASDDFTIANPLGPAAGVHKLTAVYFSIQNLPAEYLSKIDNIYIVALVHADDIKTKETDFNDIWRMVVRDIGYLEQFGISIENKTIRGTIASACFDNLGANMSLGLSEGFNSNYFCRICTLSKVECQTRCKEDISAYRTMEEYAKHLSIIEDSTKVNLTESYGVKRYCVLNDLLYFKIFINMTLDIMHDLNEGIIAFLLLHFFNLIISLKILTENSLKQKCQYYDYGSLHSKAIPSLVSLTKANLNQTASQMLCLFRHIPFIFYELRTDERLKDAWMCIQTLLKIVEIVYSSEITEADLQLLEQMVSLHLELVQKVFEVNLIPKHHFLTHYATLIRMIGPLIFISTMRYESKHQHLKKLIATSQNTINVTKSITKKHQAQLVQKNNTYSSESRHGKKIPLSQLKSKVNEAFILNSFSDQCEIFAIDWFRLNSYMYRKGLFIILECKFIEIEDIYLINNKEYFVCCKWNKIGVNNFLNSVQIEKSESTEKILVCFDDLKPKQVFERKFMDQKTFIIAETLIVNKII